MNIEMIAIDDLLEAVYNPREISGREFDDLRASLRKFDAVEPAVVNRRAGRENVIIGGHQRLKAARAEGWDTFPVYFVELDEADERELNIRLNKNGGRWDFDKLANEFDTEDLLAWGFTDSDLFGKMGEIMEETDTEEEERAEATDAGEWVQGDPVSVTGDVWICGIHRVMCGDSTQFGDIERLLLQDEEIDVIFADPPYGMGKENEGVENDNKKGDSLLKFNNEWWRTFRSRARSNANAVIFGNADVLWRWWYHPEGLDASEPLTFKNELVWAKGSAQGRGSDLGLRFPTSTERALFFNIGAFISALSRDSSQYFEEWDTIRLYLSTEGDRAGMTGKICDDLTGTQGMWGHWTGRSQWAFPTRDRYEALQKFGDGQHFTKSYDRLNDEYNRAKEKVEVKLAELRGYFSLGGDSELDDVLKVPQVQGEERHGHATPKPVELLRKILKPITRPGGIVAEPFGGSGSTLVICEELGIKSRIMEITPSWVDVIVRRWEKQTGKAAVHAETGVTFGEIKGVE